MVANPNSVFTNLILGLSSRRYFGCDTYYIGKNRRIEKVSEVWVIIVQGENQQ